MVKPVAMASIERGVSEISVRTFPGVSPLCIVLRLILLDVLSEWKDQRLS